MQNVKAQLNGAQPEGHLRPGEHKSQGRETCPARPSTTRTSTTRRGLEAPDLILRDALQGSEEYVLTYRAGRGAE